jgi:glycosyltransferase involved in cell wall biosynthesis
LVRETDWEPTLQQRAEPTVTAAVAAYNAEAWIAETLEAILGQTRPPDEVVVVDDGSTDGTAAILESFAGRVRVVRRANGGCPAAFNTAFDNATGDFVAMCGADDIWEPHKLEWQLEALRADPELDVLFGDAEIFGLVEGNYARPTGTGRLDAVVLRDALYRENLICAPSVVIRRSLFERLGPFVERFGADDYEYWMRCLRAGANFHYDPRVLLRYRRHESNLSSGLLWMTECSHEVHRWYAADLGDDALAHEVLAGDLFKIGRLLVDEGRVAEARRAFRGALRYAVTTRALVWVALLTLPAGVRDRSASTFVRLRSIQARQEPAEASP